MHSGYFERRRRRLRGRRNVLSQQLHNIEHDLDFEAAFRATKCAEIRSDIKHIDDELKELDLHQTLAVTAAVVVPLLWLAAAILCGHVFGGVVFAVMFWLGVSIGVIVAVSMWLYGKFASDS